MVLNVYKDRLYDTSSESRSKKAQFAKQKSAALSNYKNFGNTQREVASPN